MAGKRTNYLKGIRVSLACIFVFGITLMLCDFTGTTHRFLGWMAEVQFFTAVLGLFGGLSVASLLIVLLTLLVTLLFGRVYCSFVCPLGVMQDIFTWWGSRKWQRKLSKRLGRNRWRYSPNRKPLRIALLALFLVLLFTLHAYASVIEPYSAYARIASALFAPVYAWLNNVLAAIAEHYDSYAIYPVEVWLQSAAVLGISLVLFIGIGLWAFFHGRAWCNTVCPVGTILAVPAKHSLFRPTIDTDKCTGCHACERNCKARCIDADTHTIDLSRCVTCFDCITNCKEGAIHYGRASQSPSHGSADCPERSVGKTPSNFSNLSNPLNSSVSSRRTFLSALGIIAATGVAEAAHKTTDGGLAVIEDKVIPHRATPVKPAGSQSLRHFTQHCTSCQLCVTACPGHVLRPSGDLTTLMQPEMQFDRGYCIPSCTRCADVCPTEAIRPITKEEKTTIQVGHAVWIADNCVVNTGGVSCGNCARHCPTGAIIMVDNGSGLSIPAIDTEKCIGCGHCEYVCPSRPFSAIYVEGHEQHRSI